jgi:hypothetical protein
MAGNLLEVKEGSAGTHRVLSTVVKIDRKGIDGGRPVGGPGDGQRRAAVGEVPRVEEVACRVAPG